MAVNTISFLFLVIIALNIWSVFCDLLFFAKHSLHFGSKVWIREHHTHHLAKAGSNFLCKLIRAGYFAALPSCHYHLNAEIWKQMKMQVFLVSICTPMHRLVRDIILKKRFVLKNYLISKMAFHNTLTPLFKSICI